MGCLNIGVCRWKVIQNNGGFSRSGGLQSGIDSVTVRRLVSLVPPQYENHDFL